jgi:putative Mg2+ transporter-C (MgtC) family protein
VNGAGSVTALMHHINSEAIRLFASLLLGGVIGLEREISDKAAGLRTNILICVGACLFTLVSMRMFDIRDAHVVAQIVAGVGFLGAGSIMREGDKVTGLTTAATIWTVAAIGMAVGAGYLNLGATVTLIVLFVQLAFTQLDILIDDWRERHTFRIVSKLDQTGIEEIENAFAKAKVVIMRRKVMKKNNLYYSEWFTTGGRAAQDRVKVTLLQSPSVLEVTY